MIKNYTNFESTQKMYLFIKSLILITGMSENKKRTCWIRFHLYIISYLLN